MTFLGLVGAPAIPMSYGAYRALTAAGSVLSGALLAAEAAGVAAMLAQGALVLGAGYAGYMIGDAILKALERPEQIPFTKPLYKIGVGPGLARIRAFTVFNDGTTTNWDSIQQTPCIVPLIDYPGSSGQFRVYGVETITGNKFGYYQNNPPIPTQWWELTSIEIIAGTNAPPVKIPNQPQLFKPAPFKLPTTIPAPGFTPGFPITPTVIPNPGNDPDEDSKQVAPGLIVQIPELGIQVGYRPDGVTIGRYTDPNTKPFEAPKVAVPPGTPNVAEEPCPCPEEEDRSEEIICRLKALEKEILDDGYTTQTTLSGLTSSAEVTTLPEEFYLLELNSSVYPSNVKRIPYNEPGGDVLYLGWVSFIMSGVKGEQIPIRFERQHFIPPPGCRGYAYAMNSGCQASALAYSRTKKDYVDLCNV